MSLILVALLGVGCSEEADDPDAPPSDGGTYPSSPSDAGLPGQPATPRDGAVWPLPTPAPADAGGSVAVPDAGAGSDGSATISPAADAGADAGSATPAGACCPDGNCLCHGPAPSALTSAKGPFQTAQLTLPLGTVTYPADAEPPFASVALCGGFTNTGPEMASWAPFYASYGIVTIITSTGALDDPSNRGDKLLASLEQLKAEHTKTGSPLFGKLDLSRTGTSGYSMGGGGTTIASAKTPALKTSVGLAAWGPATSGVRVPTLLLCGNSDTTAPCGTSQDAYRGIADPTPKMLVAIDGATHFSWFGPTDAGNGASGKYALAFQKVYLEGDTRWAPLLTTKVAGATQTTTIR